MYGTFKTGTHGFPDPQVSAFPQAWQWLSILASGGEGEVYVLWVIPHRQLHFGPDILRTFTCTLGFKKKTYTIWQKSKTASGLHLVHMDGHVLTTAHTHAYVLDPKGTQNGLTMLLFFFQSTIQTVTSERWVETPRPKRSTAKTTVASTHSKDNVADYAQDWTWRQLCFNVAALLKEEALHGSSDTQKIR